MSAISVRNVKKVFRLYDKPINRLKEIVFQRPFHTEFAALDGITFNMEKGESLGVIGENGAGKSTLLKILAKTLSPSGGQVKINGTVSSLLELGSGLHPEFSGLENIYFYGALFGIDRITMQKKINEIIDFSELGDFINYPIKTYSSGMFVRLAFSVATSIDPDILIIDEALSVGDQYFQKKCLERMADFKKRKKTIVFCSHDMYQIRSYCDRTIWLHHGKIKEMGDSAEVVNAYVSHEQVKAGAAKTEKNTQASTKPEKKPKNSFLFIEGLNVKQENEKDLTIDFSVTAHEPFSGHVGWAILRKDGFQVSFMTTQMQGENPVSFDGVKKIIISVKDLNIVNGTYQIYVGLFDKNAYKPIIIDSLEFDIVTGYDIVNSLCHFNSTFIQA